MPAPDHYRLAGQTRREYDELNQAIAIVGRPAWDGVHPDDPEAAGHRPPCPGFRFHEGRHTHSTWLVQDGIPEVARRARLGHKMPGIARVYEHVTPEMEQQIAAALEARWAASLAELTDHERNELAGLVPDLAALIHAARRRRGSGSISQSFSHRLGAGGVIMPLTWVELRGLEPLTPSLRTLPSVQIDVHLTIHMAV